MKEGSGRRGSDREGGREGGEGRQDREGKRGKGTENLDPRQDRLRTDFLTNVIV